MSSIVKITINLFLFIAFFSPQLSAQNSLGVGNETISRDSYVDIPLTGTISAPNINSLKIEIVYDARIIDIASAEGGSSFAIRESNPKFETDFTKLDSANVTISTNDAVSINNGIICNLKIKGLVFSDSVAYVLPIKLSINGSDVTTETSGGRITVTGTPIFPNFPDNLSYGYPNPFNYQVRFDFSLKDYSKVRVKLFNMTGLQVLDSDNNKDMLSVFDSETNLKIDDLNSLTKGRYYVLLMPKQNEIASGLYFLSLQTDRQVFNTNIIYCK